MLSFKRGIWLLISFVTVFAVLPAGADLRTVHKFKKVAIPFDMTHDGTKIEKGTFDFEILVERSLSMWTLRVIKKGKVLCALPGEVLRDRAPGAAGETMAEVPEKPTLKVKRVLDEKMAHLIFENSGVETGAMLFPYYVVRFKIGLTQE